MKHPNDHPITKEEAKEKLLKCYRDGYGDTFAQFLRRQIQDPIQPRDLATSKRRLHPLLANLLIFAGIGCCVLVYFSFH